MLRTGRVSGDKWKVDICLSHVREFNLCLLSSLKESLSRHLISAEINTVIALELCNHPIHNLFIEIVTTKMSITIGCLDLEGTFTEFKN